MDNEKYRSQDWQENKLKELYYAFGTSEEEGLKLFLNLVFELFYTNPSFLEKLYDTIDEIKAEDIYEITEKTLDWVKFWKSYNQNDNDKNPVQLARLKKLKEQNYLSSENLGRLFFQLGLIESVLKNHGDAAVNYEESIRLLPDWSWPYNNLGNRYSDLGRKDEAIASFQKVIELDRKDAQAYNNLGIVYRKLGRKDEAIASYQKAIELDPKDAYPYYGLGYIYDDLGRIDEAIGSYRKAIEMDPKYANPYIGLGNVYRELDRQEEAIAAYEKAIELDPKDACPYNNLGSLHLIVGNLKKAIIYLEKAISIDANDHYALINLGITFFQLRKRKKAQDIFDSALEKCPLSAIHGCINKITALLGLERNEEALAILHQIQKQFNIQPAKKEAFFKDWNLLAASPEPPAGIVEFMEQAKEILS